MVDNWGLLSDVLCFSEYSFVPTSLESDSPTSVKVGGACGVIVCIVSSSRECIG